MTLKMLLDFVENIVIFVSAFRKPGALIHLPYTIQPEKRPLQYGQILLIAQLYNLCHCSLGLCIDFQTKMTRKYSARSVHTCKIRWSIYTPWRSDEHISRIGIFNNNIKSSFEADNCLQLWDFDWTDFQQNMFWNRKQILFLSFSQKSSSLVSYPLFTHSLFKGYGGCWRWKNTYIEIFWLKSLENHFHMCLV